MFAKLAAVILALGIVGCSLLAMRQSRLQAASELAQTQLRIGRLDERLWLLRGEIARRVSPEAVDRIAEEMGPTKAMMMEPLTIEDGRVNAGDSTRSATR